MCRKMEMAGLLYRPRERWREARDERGEESTVSRREIEANEFSH